MHSATKTFGGGGHGRPTPWIRPECTGPDRQCYHTNNQPVLHRRSADVKTCLCMECAQPQKENPTSCPDGQGSAPREATNLLSNLLVLYFSHKTTQLFCPTKPQTDKLFWRRTISSKGSPHTEQHLWNKRQKLLLRTCQTCDNSTDGSRKGQHLTTKQMNFMVLHQRRAWERHSTASWLPVKNVYESDGRRDIGQIVVRQWSPLCKIRTSCLRCARPRPRNLSPLEVA